MVSANVASLNLASQQISIYMNIINVVIGVPGAIFIIIVFLSLRTFRENTCAFYLTVMSFVNIGLLLSGSLTRFVLSALNTNWSQSLSSFCKFRSYVVQCCSLVSLTCLCLATIDQYLATNNRPHWQQYSNIRLVHRLTVITVIFWSIYAILYTVFYDVTTATTTNALNCMGTNAVFRRYDTYAEQLILNGFLPNIITVSFAYLSYRNIQNIAYRTIPLVRRELDKQLTRMLLLQVIYNIFALLLYNIVTVILPSIASSNDPAVSAKLLLVRTFSYGIYYSYSACPFYIYICVSERFRRQFVHVFGTKYFKQCQQATSVHNEVAPQT